MYKALSRIFPTAPPPENPQRIVLIRPCCIGDVVLATATLMALRRGFSNAHITWAVGGWSRQAIANHPHIDAVLDTGKRDLPVRSVSGFVRFVRDLRQGEFDMAVSLVRSPLMSLAVRVSGIAHRVGLDSNGRGFGYTLRVPVDPGVARHEAQIYLDVARALNLNTDDCYANIPVTDTDRERARRLRESQDIRAPYIVLNPTGGKNPGMTLDAKRWTPRNFANLGDRLASRYDAQIVLIGGPADAAIVNTVGSAMQTRVKVFIGQLTFGEIGALAAESLVYVGNDTGLTHLSSASGAKTAMILGPTDPARYAPFTPESIALWRPTDLQTGGVASGAPRAWDWARDGISVDEVEAQLVEFLDRS